MRVAAPESNRRGLRLKDSGMNSGRVGLRVWMGHWGSLNSPGGCGTVQTVNTMDLADHELALLRSICERTTGSMATITQRDLSRIVGISLGMTNAILKRLAHKGWVTVRRVNARSLLYAISPSGLEEIARRSYKYFRRTIGHIARYKENIQSSIHAAVRERGLRGVVLVGASDMDFILEHVCTKEHLLFRRSEVLGGDPGYLHVISETVERGSGGKPASDASSVYMEDMLMEV
jgi:DNA-binding PadR family transcriptional regulator